MYLYENAQEIIVLKPFTSFTSVTIKTIPEKYYYYLVC